MRGLLHIVLLPTIIFLAGCNHLLSIEAQPADPSPQTPEAPELSTTLPDMPSWVKFVRFRPHTHNTATAESIHQHDALAMAHPAPVDKPGPSGLQPHFVTTSAVDTETKSLENTPVESTVSVEDDSDQACRGQGGYVDADSERWLSERDENRWTIQLISASDETEPCVDQYLTDLNATDARRFAVYFKSAIWHIALSGDYPSAEAAMKAAKHYPAPWVRQFSELRSRRCASVRRVRGLGDQITPWCNAATALDEVAVDKPVAVSLPDAAVPSL